jgi:glycosyltransferase involved in cell wall biosynthesis
VTALRVAYVLGTTAGGTGRHVAMLAEGCLQAGIAVSVFGPQVTRGLFPAGSTETAPAVAGAAAEVAGQPAGVVFEPVEIAERPRPARDAAAVARLRRLLADPRPDVVHAHGLRAGAVAALALGPARRYGPALVVTVHNGPPAGFASRQVYGLLERVVARRSDTVLCVSRDLAGRMDRLGARRTAIAVVPAPLAAAPSAEAVARARADIGAAGQPVVLAVGRLTGQKGFDTLLAAAGRWQDRSPRPLLAIAGDGPLAASLASSAQAAGLAVCFLGRRADVRALLAAADVLAAPSRWEGQPLLLQEALQQGTPIVASHVGGLPDLLDRDAALLVPPEDPAELAAAVLRVLDDKVLAGRLAAAGRARAAVLPSAADAMAAAIAAYGLLADSSGPSR